MSEHQIQEFLIRLGIGPSCKGFPYFIRAIYLVITQYSFQCPTMKYLYRNIASHFGTSPNAVQYGIRSVLESEWTPQNQKLFVEITGYPAGKAPTPKEFIAVSANYLRQAGQTH